MLDLMVDHHPEPGSPPSNEERLDAIRAHADSTKRYYTTAYLGLARRGADRLRGGSPDAIADDTALQFARQQQDEVFWGRRERT
jgi:hypothetical protein